LAHESIALGREFPVLIRQTIAKQGPRIEAVLRDRFSGAFDESEHEAATPSKLDGPAFRVRPLPDGSLAVHVERGVALESDHQGRHVVGPNDKPNHPPLDIDGLIDQATASVRHYIEANSLALIAKAQKVIAAVARGIFLLFMVLMVAGYLMATSETILTFFRSLLPKNERPSWDQLLKRVDRGLSGVIRGQLLICVVNGVLSAIGFWLFGLKYWPILSLVAMVFSIIPIFGAILSSVPAVAVGLTQDVWTAIWVLVWIIGIHQVEANLLNPKIIGVSAKIHPVLVVFSLLVGEHYFGLFGALFAVPVLSISQSVFNHFRFLYLDDAGPDSLGVRELLASGRSPVSGSGR
jgi:predicted PurR-regulated permease PerM